MRPNFCDWIQESLECPWHKRTMKIIRKFLADETAATAIEYGLIAAGIAIAIITAVKGVGTKLSTNFNTISTSLK
jgi:pilus assembly protein Flp/PilA